MKLITKETVTTNTVVTYQDGKWYGKPTYIRHQDRWQIYPIKFGPSVILKDSAKIYEGGEYQSYKSLIEEIEMKIK